MTIFSSLTATQQAQAAYLFADAELSNDPTQYEYELQGEDVIGRSRIAKAGDRVHAFKKHTVQVNMTVKEVPDQFVTVEMSRKAEVAINEFARRVTERIIQSQSVEA